MSNWLKRILLSKYLGSFVRTLLAVVAGWLVSQGILDSDEVEPLVDNLTEIIVGVLLYLIAQGSSLVQKRLDD